MSAAAARGFLERVHVAFDQVQQARAALLGQAPGVGRCLWLAELAEVEAGLWGALFEHAKVRAHWRAALGAREHALRSARYWRHRATTQHSPHPAAAPLAGRIVVGVS